MGWDSAPEAAACSRHERINSGRYAIDPLLGHFCELRVRCLLLVEVLLQQRCAVRPPEFFGPRDK
jgi:hypothetical protein